MICSHQTVRSGIGNHLAGQTTCAKIRSRTQHNRPTSGFRAVDKKLIERFASNYPVEYPEPVSTTEVLRLGYRVEEIPVSMNERENGVSSIKAWKNVYYMINVILSIVIIGLGVSDK